MLGMCGLGAVALLENFIQLYITGQLLDTATLLVQPAVTAEEFPQLLLCTLC